MKGLGSNPASAASYMTLGEFFNLSKPHFYWIRLFSDDNTTTYLARLQWRMKEKRDLKHLAEWLAEKCCYNCIIGDSESPLLGVEYKVTDGKSRLDLTARHWRRCEGEVGHSFHTSQGTVTTPNLHCAHSQPHDLLSKRKENNYGGEGCSKKMYDQQE